MASPSGECPAEESSNCALPQPDESARMSRMRAGRMKVSRHGVPERGVILTSTDVASTPRRSAGPVALSPGMGFTHRRSFADPRHQESNRMNPARASYLFTSESVSEGHPDKVADRISDTVVDAFLAADPYARVACETMVTTNRIILAGEVRGPDGVVASLEEKVRAAVKDIGYEQAGFHWKTADYACHLHSQSGDIAMGVDAAGNKDEGAGDQGIMFGYATSETPELMPATLQYSHNILKLLAKARHGDASIGLEPDAKSQVTLVYENGKPVRGASIVLSTQHREGLTPADISDIVRPYILKVFPEGFIDEATAWHINPTGNFVIGGPDGDCGLTGRKIIVDTYGGAAPHGGGAFSGKDPTKVDRSAAYACRYLAKNVVAAGVGPGPVDLVGSLPEKAPPPCGAAPP